MNWLKLAEDEAAVEDEGCGIVVDEADEAAAAEVNDG